VAAVVKPDSASSSSFNHHQPEGIAGIILAAGESRRMGRDKALLPLGPMNFLQRLIDVLRTEVPLLVVVLGHHADEIERQIVQRENIVLLRNPDYSRGQLSSIQIAVEYLLKQPVSAALLALVDHPAITREVVQALLRRYKETNAPILIPTHNGRRGHPVVFAKRLFPELLAAPLDEGARYVVHQHSAEIDFVETNEPGILLDIDFPADYEALLKRWAEPS
jgi:molybdenum cofactor cytidylyltransferase